MAPFGRARSGGRQAGDRLDREDWHSGLVAERQPLRVFLPEPDARPLPGHACRPSLPLPAIGLPERPVRRSSHTARRPRGAHTRHAPIPARWSRVGRDGRGTQAIRGPRNVGVFVQDVDAGENEPSRDTGPSLPTGVPVVDLAARIAIGVQSCPLIAGLHSGELDRIVTLTEAGRLVGVRLDGDVVEVGVVGRAGADPDRVVDQVRAAVTECVAVARVDVRIAADHDSDTDTVVDGGALG